MENSKVVKEAIQEVSKLKEILEFLNENEKSINKLGFKIVSIDSNGKYKR